MTPEGEYIYRDSESGQSESKSKIFSDAST